MASESWIIFLLSLFSVSLVECNELARGWGDDIGWVKLEDGLKLAKEQNKPLLLLIHKSWCGACKALKPDFAASTDIKELSSNFIMVQTQDDEEPKGDQYTPDGGYIPRVLFLDPKGKVRKEFTNKDGNQQYKYYYPMADQIATTMRQVVKRNGSS
ncbi:hypothetical protein KUTeg_015834 [Tegillarca granosa]|uniref:Thioredoxin domain-containing protein 12 n=1 Tax=Tegillarca granosa TaxID=220873 RepID=A0ABQ9EJ34_TEGGR|nr:hypothetical protein KUTeg_015834 [Tegillarca granosa]